MLVLVVCTISFLAAEVEAPTLLSKKHSERIVAQSNILQQRRKDINDALKVLKTSALGNIMESQDPRIPAIEVLGTLRATDATKILVDNMELKLKQRRVLDDGHDPYSLYPAIQSLRAIGRPASSEFIRRISKLDVRFDQENRVKKRLRLLSVLVEFEGQEVAIALIKKKISAPGLPKHIRENLEKALTALQDEFGRK